MPADGDETSFDCVIIGAGISGIATAKTFIADHGFKTLVIEKYDTVGGDSATSVNNAAGFPTQSEEPAFVVPRRTVAISRE